MSLGFVVVVVVVVVVIFSSSIVRRVCQSGDVLWAAGEKEERKIPFHF